MQEALRRMQNEVIPTTLAQTPRSCPTAAVLSEATICEEPPQSEQILLIFQRCYYRLAVTFNERAPKELLKSGLVLPCWR